MFTGRRTTDWLRETASGQARGGDEGDRRGSERRSNDRRAPRRPIDPLFATTLLNNLLPPAPEPVRAYAAPLTALRPGIAFNRWA